MNHRDNEMVEPAPENTVRSARAAVPLHTDRNQSQRSTIGDETGKFISTEYLN